MSALFEKVENGEVLSQSRAQNGRKHIIRGGSIALKVKNECF